MQLSSRQKKVLLSIVNIYSKTHKPVSSEDVLKASKINISSATIRNDMQKLQHLKYIYQQHTSGGRVPTDKALRLYFELIEQVYSHNEYKMELPKNYKFYDLNIMFENISKMISSILDGLIIFEYPDPKYIYITRCVVSPLTENNYVVTLLTNLGLTISRTVDNYGLPNCKELEEMLNSGLNGKSLDEIFIGIRNQSIQSDDERVTNIFNLINGLLDEFTRKKYIVNGLEKIIAYSKPSLETIESLTMIIENETIKDELFKDLEFSKDLNLFFGKDINSKALKNYVFFYTSYCKGFDAIGRSLLIVDKYNDYEKVFKVLKEYNSRFSEIISKNL